jgi:hypothetical protein
MYFFIYFTGRLTRQRASKEINNKEESFFASDCDEKLKLEVKIFPMKGRGIVAKKKIIAKEWIVEYAGELLDVTERDKRVALYSLDPRTGSYIYEFIHNGKKMFIDATKENGRFGRLANHSIIHANSIMKKVVYNNIPHLVLVATKDINVGEEIRYDYNDRSKESLLAYPWLSRAYEKKLEKEEKKRKKRKEMSQVKNENFVAAIQEDEENDEEDQKGVRDQEEFKGHSSTKIADGVLRIFNAYHDSRNNSREDDEQCSVRSSSPASGR